MSPLVSCEFGLICQFFVPASDPDGDQVRWRLASGCEAGCGFSQPPGFSVDSGTGLVTFDTSQAILSFLGYSLYSTQIVIEDLDSGGLVKNKTVVDFMIRVQPAPPIAPVFDVPPTPPAGSTLNASVGQQLTFTLQASDPEPADVVTLGDVGLPSGMACNYPSPSNPVTATCTWTPTSGQSGTHLVIFTATDNNGLGAAPHSLHLHVAHKAPVIDYFALGDSVASGHGLNDDGSACRRSSDAYPRLVEDLLLERYHVVNLHFYACSGAKVGYPGGRVPGLL
jgi:hypothetical protein